MFQFLFQCVKNFGIPNGLIIYTRIKLIRTGKIFLPGLEHPVYFRQNTSDVHTFREIFLRKEYSIKLPLNFSPTLIIDAGANIGFTSLFFLKQFLSAKIISLEPDQNNFELLKKNTSGYSRVIPLQAALWNKEGSIEIMNKG